MENSQKLHGEITWEDRLIYCATCKRDMDILSTSITELDRAWVNHSIEHFQGRTKSKRKPRDKGAIV